MFAIFYTVNIVYVCVFMTCSTSCADVRLSVYTCAGCVYVTALLWRFWSSGMLRLVSSSEASKKRSASMFRVK